MVGGGGKARQVAYHAAAQGDDTIAAGKAIVKQGLHQGGIGGKRFGFFSVGENKAGDPEACVGQRHLGGGAVEGINPVIGHQHGPAGGQEGRGPGAQVREQARGDAHLIGVQGPDGYGGHRCVTSRSAAIWRARAAKSSGRRAWAPSHRAWRGSL